MTQYLFDFIYGQGWQGVDQLRECTLAIVLCLILLNAVVWRLV